MRAICVDDEQLVLEDIIYECEKTKEIESVEGFLTLNKAIERIKQGDINIAFLDIDMPEINGIDLARKLKELDPTLYIVFTTGYPQYALDAFGVNAVGYLLKPVESKAVEDILKHIKYLQSGASKGIRVRTFGNFDVYVDGQIMSFKRSKAKEILAYIIDKKGTGVTRKELAAYVLDRDDYDESTINYLNQIIYGLKNDLKNYGIESILKTEAYGELAIDVTKIDCDKYRFDKGEEEAVNAYQGEYMAGYEWAEDRLEYIDRAAFAIDDFK